MKKLLVGLLALGSISSFAMQSSISEKGTNRKLIYSQVENEIVLKLSDSNGLKELKRLRISNSDDEVSLIGDIDTYSFQVFKASKDITSAGYDWCFTNKINMYELEDPMERWFAAQAEPAFASILTPASLPLCATLPAVPVIAGALLFPIDALITLGDKLFDVDAIAARKFSKLVRGKNKKASKKVFRSIIQQIKKL